MITSQVHVLVPHVTYVLVVDSKARQNWLFTPWLG